jgi:hypothetical protein
LHLEPLNIQQMYACGHGGNSCTFMVVVVVVKEARLDVVPVARQVQVVALCDMSHVELTKIHKSHIPTATFSLVNAVTHNLPTTTQTTTTMRQHATITPLISATTLDYIIVYIYRNYDDDEWPLLPAPHADTKQDKRGSRCRCISSPRYFF